LRARYRYVESLANADYFPSSKRRQSISSIDGLNTGSNGQANDMLSHATIMAANVASSLPGVAANAAAGLMDHGKAVFNVVANYLPQSVTQAANAFMAPTTPTSATSPPSSSSPTSPSPNTTTPSPSSDTKAMTVADTSSPLTTPTSNGNGSPIMRQSMLMVLLSLKRQLSTCITISERECSLVTAREHFSAMEARSQSLLHICVNYMFYIYRNTPTPMVGSPMERLRNIAHDSDPVWRYIAHRTTSGAWLKELVSSQPFIALMPPPTSQPSVTFDNHIDPIAELAGAGPLPPLLNLDRLLPTSVALVVTTTSSSSPSRAALLPPPTNALPSATTTRPPPSLPPPPPPSKSLHVGPLTKLQNTSNGGGGGDEWVLIDDHFAAAASARAAAAATSGSTSSSTDGVHVTASLTSSTLITSNMTVNSAGSPSSGILPFFQDHGVALDAFVRMHRYLILSMLSMTPL
jgi:hypothetical protein